MTARHAPIARIADLRERARGVAPAAAAAGPRAGVADDARPLAVAVQGAAGAALMSHAVANLSRLAPRVEVTSGHALPGAHVADGVELTLRARAAGKHALVLHAAFSERAGRVGPAALHALGRRADLVRSADGIGCTRRDADVGRWIAMRTRGAPGRRTRERASGRRADFARAACVPAGSAVLHVGGHVDASAATRRASIQAGDGRTRIDRTGVDRTGVLMGAPAVRAGRGRGCPVTGRRVTTGHRREAQRNEHSDDASDGGRRASSRWSAQSTHRLFPHGLGGARSSGDPTTQEQSG